MNFIYCQNEFNKFSFKVGIANSTQSKDLFILTKIRPFEKSIQGVFVNLEYAIPVKKNLISFGFQLIEKGFKTIIYLDSKNYKEETEYQNSLSYFEFPINYVLINKRYNIIAGLLFSYMYENNYRIKETGISYGSPNIVIITNGSIDYDKVNDRYKKYDLGINIGLSKKIIKNIALELNLQKHFIRIDKHNYDSDLLYNMCFLFGIKHSFL